MAPRLLKGSLVNNRILIVDDEESTLFVFSRLLQRLNAPIDVARTFDEAEQVLGEHDYRVVVTDLRLTGALGEEGIDVLRRAREKNPSPAVIVVTGYGCPSAMTKAFSLGAAYYFEKPVRPVQLLHAVESLCQA